MGPFDPDIRASIVEARRESLRASMAAAYGPRAPRPRRAHPVRTRVGRGLIALGERLEPYPAR